MRFFQGAAQDVFYALNVTATAGKLVTASNQYCTIYDCIRLNQILRDEKNLKVVKAFGAQPGRIVSKSVRAAVRGAGSGTLRVISKSVILEFP